VGVKETTHKIISSPNQVVLDTGQVLRPPAADKHDAVLLDIVALARDDGRDLAAIGEPHTSSLALAGVGLLGTRDAYFEADAFHLGAAGAGEDGRDGSSGLLALAAALK
jgi:hypothetical protein